MGLKERIESGEAVFGVVGLGYVGLPLVIEMAKSGHRVIGLEVSEAKAATFLRMSWPPSSLPDSSKRPRISRARARSTSSLSAFRRRSMR
jgi:UDP-N-acetyl-D-glucosamine dehydrogenase